MNVEAIGRKQTVITPPPMAHQSDDLGGEVVSMAAERHTICRLKLSGPRGALQIGVQN